MPSEDKSDSRNESESEATKRDADGTESGSQKSDADKDESLREAGKAALQREREAREVAERELTRLKREQAKRDEAEATAKGEFEKLATERQKRIDELEAAVTERDRLDRRRAMRQKHHLAEDLEPLISGETDVEMEAAAKLLAKHAKAPAAADTEAGSGNRSASNGISNKQIEGKPSATPGEAAPNYSFLPARGVPIPNA